VGSGAVYAPLRIATANVTALYDSAFYNSNPATVTPTPFAAIDGTTLDAISTTSYWDVQSTATATVSLTWSGTGDIAGQVTYLELADLTIAGWNGTQWEAITSTVDLNNFNGGIASNLTAGSITSDAVVDFAMYTKFTLAKKGGCSPLVAFNEVTVTWSGAAWSNGSGPTLANPVIIAGAYANGSFVCNSLVLDADVTLGANEHVEIVNGATGSSKIIMNTSASVVQRAADAAAPFVEITKIATDMTRWDYIYFGTPIEGDFFTDFATARGTGGPTAAFDLFYRHRSGAGTGTPWEATTTTTAGRGLIARVAQAAPFVDGVATATITVVLDGVANNGDVTLTASNSPALLNGGRSHVLLGNPYPSAIDGNKFLEENTDLDGALYVWNSTTPYMGTGLYNQADYLTYTKAGFVLPTPLSSISAFTGKIPSGQAFMAKILPAAISPASTARTATITFNNCMRVTGDNSIFFKNTAQNDVTDRFKVNMTGANGVFSEILVAYLPQATLGYDRMYDAGRNSVSSAQLYSIFEDDGKRLAINARPPFFNTDVVPVGFRKTGTATETFTFSLTDKEGVFSTGSVPVYIHDKVLNTYHDLTAGSFDFTTGLTTVDTRFELVYTTGTLGTMDSLLPVTTASIVDGTFTVASTDVIKDIQVYDLAGRLLQNYTTINEVQFTAPFNHAAGLYIAHVSYESGLGSGLKLIHVRN
jgi:hypothetical protein